MSDTTSLFLEPVDVWLFRDGKPFSANDDHFADSIFPPLPTVVQGAIRSHYLVTEKVPLAKANRSEIARKVGTATNFLDLRIKGPFLCKGRELYFPLPADVVLDKVNGKFHALKPAARSAGTLTNSSTPMLLQSDCEPGKFEAGYISRATMATYLEGKPFEVDKADLFERESRIGIARNDASRVTQPGALYEVRYIRMFDGAGLYVEFSGLPNWKIDQGVMRIGGEGHAARFRQVALSSALPAPRITSRRFKLVLLTPTYFEGGWQPKDWNSHFTGGKVTLQAAALNRYLSAGGYDWAKDEHKPALRYVPAGSVYYFSADADVKLKNGWLCDVSPEGAPLGQIGFGQVLAGTW
jgi:CRISPR-associated protein Cmr3